MKKIFIYTAASLLLAVAGTAQADGIIELGTIASYSGAVGSLSTGPGASDEVWKAGTATSRITASGVGCLDCSETDVDAFAAASEGIANVGHSQSDMSDEQTSSVGEGVVAVGAALKIGDSYQPAGIVEVGYLNTTAGVGIGSNVEATSDQWGDAGGAVNITYTGPACPGGGNCGATDMTMSGYVDNSSTSFVHATGNGGMGAIANNAGLLINQIKINAGQLPTQGN